MSDTKIQNKTKSDPKTTPQEINNPQVTPRVYSKSEFIHAKAIIAAYKDQNKNRPKRQCSEKQLEALKHGREKNPRMNKKQNN